MERIKVNKSGQRLDVFLTEYFQGIHTRSQITNSIALGRTLLNGQRVKSGTVLRMGDIIDAEVERADVPCEPEELHIDVVFEDDYLMIVNKPRGLVVHPGAGNKKGTLLNGLLFRGNLLDRGGIVHRLDKNTSGLMVVAKTSEAQAKLGECFERHEISRTYLGLVEGRMTGSGTIDQNIIRDPKHRTLFKTTAHGGRRAVTHFKVIQNLLSPHNNKEYSLVQFNLETGRTHQIRVHCKSVGHPLVGDPEYNTSGDGQLLESVEISFTHPVTGGLVKHTIPISGSMRKTVDRLVPLFYDEKS